MVAQNFFSIGPDGPAGDGSPAGDAGPAGETGSFRATGATGDIGIGDHSS